MIRPLMSFLNFWRVGGFFFFFVTSIVAPSFRTRAYLREVVSLWLRLVLLLGEKHEKRDGGNAGENITSALLGKLIRNPPLDE